MSSAEKVQKMKAAILGLAVADALGVPVEFSSREQRRMDPVVDMRGYGTHRQPVGTWSDDTAMTLCLMESLQRGLNYTDIADNFVKWYDESYLTARDIRFDIGRTTRRAITNYKKQKNPFKSGGIEEMDAGNGSLMRILPIVFYLDDKYGYPFYQNAEAMTIIQNVSAITHGVIRCTISCGIYCAIAQELLHGADIKSAVDKGIAGACAYYRAINSNWREEIDENFAMNYDSLVKKPEDQIYSTGYVLDALIASLWCFVTTQSYEECVLRAVNLGKDTDTVAAIAGGLAGIYYGYDSIPEVWRNQLIRRELIESLCEALYPPTPCT